MYWEFIKDFSKIKNPLCKLLENEVNFVFDDAFLKAFECLKERLVSTPIIVSPNWTLLFEVLCDARGMALGAFLAKDE